MVAHSERALHTEEWRAIPGIANYEASNLGRVRSLERLIVSATGARRLYPEHILAPQFSNNGYYQVTIGRKTYNIGALVCRAFKGPPPSPRHEVAHWDNVRTNNTPENLRWATKKENHADKIRHGTRQIGSKSGRAKLTEAAVVEIRRLASAGKRKVEIASRYGVSESLIYAISARSRWRHI